MPNGSPDGIIEIQHSSGTCDIASATVLNALRLSPNSRGALPNGQKAAERVLYYVWNLRDYKPEPNMSDDSLLDELTTFLDSSTANRICQPYGVAPRDALGELFLRLSPRARQPIRDPSAWVRANATGLLRNYLHSEHSRLRQPREAWT